jgi:peptidoglycan hydrolase CwlO-like protein
MEEKERYKLESPNGTFSQIHDTKLDVWYLNRQPITELLNQQDKRIKELEEENKQLTELYDELNKRYCKQQDELDIVREENQQLKQKVKENRQHAEFWQSAYKRCIDREEKSQRQFAIATLEKVKEKFGYKHNTQLVVSSRYLCEFIDNQIKELKGEE